MKSESKNTEEPIIVAIGDMSFSYSATGTVTYNNLLSEDYAVEPTEVWIKRGNDPSVYATQITATVQIPSGSVQADPYVYDGNPYTVFYISATDSGSFAVLVKE